MTLWRVLSKCKCKHFLGIKVMITFLEVELDADGADFVTIRIRFIDETQFEVRSPLTATLGQFKSRHLKPGSNETSPIRATDRVRLIFNGKVLSSDSSTLAQLGLQGP